MSSESSVGKGQPSSNVFSTSNPDEITLRDLFLKIKYWIAYLISKKGILLLCMIIGGLIGAVYAHFKKPIYTAKCNFVLEENNNNGGIGQYAGLASSIGFDMSGGGGGIFQGDNIIELYKSHKMIKNTLLSEININGKKEKLIDYYIDFNKLREGWSSNPKLQHIKFDNQTNEPFTRLQDSVLSNVASQINKECMSVSKPDKKLGIISVEVSSTDEIFSKEFDDKIVKNVNDFYIETKTKKEVKNITILQHQTDSVRAILNGAISYSAAGLDATPNLNPTKQTLRVPVQRAQLNMDANKTIFTQLISNLELAKISLRKETPLIQVIDSPVFPLDKERLGHIKGAVFGMFLSIFLTIIYLTCSFILKSILTAE